jgi:membrane-associated protein
MPSALELLTFAENLINQWGIVIIPIGAFLENSVILGFIFPGVTLIFLSGFVARTTDVSLVFVVALAVLGSIIGDNFDYFIGRKTGKVIETKPLFSKPILAVEPFLMKHGVWAVFAGRFSGWSRAWVALACGVVKFNYLKFLVVSSISAVIWTSAWIVGGYLLGGNKELIEQWFTRGSLIVWIGFAAGLVYYFRTRIRLIFDILKYIVKRRDFKFKNHNGEIVEP